MSGGALAAKKPHATELTFHEKNRPDKNDHGGIGQEQENLRQQSA